MRRGSFSDEHEMLRRTLRAFGDKEESDDGEQA